MKKKKIIIFITLGLLFLMFIAQPVYGATGTTYTVQSGDTLFKIAQQYQTTVEKLVQLNKISNPNLIYPGQVIIVTESSEPVGYLNYIVQPGDTLYRIAIEFNTTVTKLVELNKINNPSLILVGQVLIIPATDTQNSPTFSYVVQPGDTLFKLANQFGTTVEEIVKLNKITNPNLIQVGQVLVIPGINSPIPQQKLVYRGNPNRKQVALTFDGGGGGTYASKQLAILKNYNVKATVFLTGKWIENFPTLAKTIATDGYEIGNHSYSHPYMTQISDAKIQEEVIKTEKLIMGLGAKKPNLFRPPYGARNTHLDNLVNNLGYSSIMWSIDTIDWKNPGPQAIIDKIKNNIQNGSIVLMHLDAPDTVNALPEIITWLRNQGYQLVTVSEIIQ